MKFSDARKAFYVYAVFGENPQFFTEDTPFDLLAVVNQEEEENIAAIGSSEGHVLHVYVESMDEWEGHYSDYLLLLRPDGSSALWRMTSLSVLQPHIYHFKPVSGEEFRRMPEDFQAEARSLGYRSLSEQQVSAAEPVYDPRRPSDGPSNVHG